MAYTKRHDELNPTAGVKILVSERKKGIFSTCVSISLHCLKPQEVFLFTEYLTGSCEAIGNSNCIGTG